MGTRRGIHTDRTIAGSVHSHAAVVFGVREALRNTRGRRVVTYSVPRLLQSAAPFVATPICVFDAAPRAVRCPFPVRYPRRRESVDPVTCWSIECDLQEYNSVRGYTEYNRRIQPGGYLTQLDTRETQLMNS